MKNLLLALLLGSSCQLPAQDTTAVLPDTIPFVLTEHNNMIVQTVLNGADTLDLMFHTAISSVSITTEALEKARSLHIDQSTEVQSWGGKSEAGYSENNRLQIGSFVWDSLSIWTSGKSGHYSDGKFGPDLFAGKMVELNFTLSALIVHAQLPLLDEAFQQFPVAFEDGSMFMEGTCRIGTDSFPNRFLIHSGYGGSILLDDAFATANGYGEKLQVTSESELKDSYGNVLKTKQAILPSFTVGGVEFTELPIAFFEGKIGNQKMSVLGGALLKQFDVIFDLKREHLYLRRNDL